MDFFLGAYSSLRVKLYLNYFSLSTLNEISDEDKHIIERFVCLLHNRTSKFTCVNECRRYLFCAVSHSIENCPLTSVALEQHINRSRLQARCNKMINICFVVYPCMCFLYSGMVINFSSASKNLIT